MSSAQNERVSESAAPRVGFVRYIVLAALCAAALIAYVQRNSIGMAEERMRDDMCLRMTEMSAVISAFFLSYALLQIPTGWVAKWFGTRLSLTAFVALFSVAAGGMGLAGGWLSLSAVRFAMGALQAGMFPCAVNTISKWMPAKQHAFANGVLAACMSLGGAIGLALTGILLPTIGWRWAFALYGLPGFVFAIGFYVWFRDRPREHAAVEAGELALIEGRESAAGPDVSKAPQESPAEPTPWLEIACSLSMWALCGQQLFRAAAYMFFTSWFSTYLRETRGVKDVAAGILSALPVIAVVIASPLGGVLSDRILLRTGSLRWSRQGLSAICMVVCGLLIVASYPVANVWLAVLVISAGSFFAAIGNPCSYTAAIDMGGKHVPMVFSLMNMSGNLGAFVFPFVVTLLLQKGKTPGSGNWTLVLFLFAFLYLAAAVCWVFADARYVVGRTK